MADISVKSKSDGAKSVKRCFGLALALTVLMPVAAETQAPPAKEGQTRVRVASQGLQISASLGSYCLKDVRGNVGCADARYVAKPTRGRLPIRGGGRVTILLGARATRVLPDLVRPNSAGTAPVRVANLRARRQGPGGKRWTVKLPRRVSSAAAIHISVGYPDRGAATFGAGVQGPRPCE